LGSRSLTVNIQHVKMLSALVFLQIRMFFI
jgi:hypothetical protein